MRKRPSPTRPNASIGRPGDNLHSPVVVSGDHACYPNANTKRADMIHEIEDGRRRLSWQNLDEISALARELS